MRYFVLLLLIFPFSSCKKKTPEPKYGTLNIKLIDSPAQYDHVYIDIQQVKINHSELGWLNAGPTITGVYDLLDFNNGIDTLLFSNKIAVGKITQIRLVLGTNNTLVKDGITYALSVPGSAESGLKINVQEDITENGNVTRWVDFDAYRSIIQLGNGTYKLMPVLRSYNTNGNGIIKGSIIPLDADPLVYAISNGDTMTAIPENNGSFQFNGMNGIYDLYFVPFNTSYTGFSLLNQQVAGGQVLDLGAHSF